MLEDGSDHFEKISKQNHGPSSDTVAWMQYQSKARLAGVKPFEFSDFRSIRKLIDFNQVQFSKAASSARAFPAFNGNNDP